jgi:hypothetical protein
MFGSTTGFSSSTAKTYVSNNTNNCAPYSSFQNSAALYGTDVLVTNTLSNNYPSKQRISSVYINFAGSTATFASPTLIPVFYTSATGNTNGIFYSTAAGVYYAIATEQGGQVLTTWAVPVQMTGSGATAAVSSIGNKIVLFNKMTTNDAASVFIQGAPDKFFMGGIDPIGGYQAYLTLSSFPYGNLSSANFVGFCDANYANGTTATVKNIGSVTTTQSGLTPGTIYYVGYGTVVTTPNTGVVAGVAISATNLLIKGN